MDVAHDLHKGGSSLKLTTCQVVKVLWCFQLHFWNGLEIGSLNISKHVSKTLLHIDNWCVILNTQIRHSKSKTHTIV